MNSSPNALTQQPGAPSVVQRHTVGLEYTPRSITHVSIMENPSQGMDFLLTAIPAGWPPSS